MNKILLMAAVGVIVIMAAAVLIVGRQAPSEETSAVPTPMTQEPTIIQEGTPLPTVNEEESGAEEAAVKITNFAFSPKTITVKKGTTVTWTNDDSVSHTATSDDGSFDTGMLAKGESGSVTFDKTGTFNYHCTPHPNMKGTIVVE